MGPRLPECCRQVEAEVVSKSRNKIPQTWGPPISGALYTAKVANVINVNGPFVEITTIIVDVDGCNITFRIGQSSLGVLCV